MYKGGFDFLSWWNTAPLPIFFSFLGFCIVSLHSFTVYHSMVYKEWNEHRTTAFKGVFTVDLACIKHVMVLNLVEYCSFPGFLGFCVVSLHSFAVYHTEVYEEWNGH